MTHLILVFAVLISVSVIVGCSSAQKHATSTEMTLTSKLEVPKESPTNQFAGIQIAVEGDLIYWIDNGDLYGARIRSTNKKRVDQGGWSNTDIAVSNGILYWTSGGDLYAARLNALTPLESGAAQRVDANGWGSARIAVSEGVIYWTANDNLYGALLNGSFGLVPGTSQQINSGGWSNTNIAVSEGILYWTSGPDLYAAPLNKLNKLVSGSARRIDSNGWNTTDISASRSSIYWIHNDPNSLNNLARGGTREPAMASALNWIGTQAVKQTISAGVKAATAGSNPNQHEYNALFEKTKEENRQHHGSDMMQIDKSNKGDNAGDKSPGPIDRGSAKH